MKGIVITGIHTDVGKTRVAAVVSAGLGWAYWKPVQTGLPTDTERIQGWGLPTYPERYRLALPAAPLVAAQAEGISILWEEISALPPTEPLVIEGAGGLYVPLTPRHFLIDLFEQWRLPLLLVVRPYLGAMNHTWLSIIALRNRGLPLLGIVLNGTTGDSSEAYFKETFDVMGELPWEESLDPHRAFYESGLAETLPSRLEAHFGL
ncbi:MAG: dethiobiotin synthase [Bacteroidia bacterium]|nr:dethiobiotin synthase [Bacteroidia bacterium]MDW8015440.1 dethiobiotin synthase [Bacteroidia bacterium]